MSQTTEAAKSSSIRPRACATCAFWIRDEHPGMMEAVKVWGYCTIGLPTGTTMTGRQTTDMLCCTGHVYREVKA